jgi:NADH-quinone oxidoreductase subunit N
LMYFDEASEAFDRPMGRELSVILVVTAVFTLFFFVSPEPLVGNAAAAAAALFEG